MTNEKQVDNKTDIQSDIMLNKQHVAETKYIRATCAKKTTF